MDAVWGTGASQLLLLLVMITVILKNADFQTKSSESCALKKKKKRGGGGGCKLAEWVYLCKNKNRQGIHNYILSNIYTEY